ncbi:MAG: hypothetical protein AAGA03_03440 [Planctomycetota bacterium]
MSDSLILPMTAAETALAELERELNRLQRSIRQAIQAKLREFEGRTMGDLAANREMVTTIHRLLDGHGLRVRCSECGHPAILRVSPRKGMANGAFVFDHTIEGKRTFHGGSSVMPSLLVTSKPIRNASGSQGSVVSG